MPETPALTRAALKRLWPLLIALVVFFLGLWRILSWPFRATHRAGREHLVPGGRYWRLRYPKTLFGEMEE